MPRRIERPAGILALVAFAAMGASAARASAPDDGWYLSAGYGAAPRLFLRSELNEALVDQFSNTPLTLGSTSVTRHGSTYSAGVGYWFAENLAIEGSYLHMGKVHYHADGSARISSADKSTNLELDAKARGGTLALAWMPPLWNDWGAELRAGAYIGRTDTRYTSVVGGDTISRSVSKKSTVPLLGAGASYTASAHLVIKLQYAHFFGVEEATLEDKFAADVVTLGLSYAF